MRALAITAGLALGALSGAAGAAIINLPTTGPLEHAVTLEAGTWQITPVDGTYTAYSVWNFVAGCNASGTNCSNGYRWAYSLRDGAANDVSSFNTTDLVGNTATAATAFSAASDAGPFTFTLDSAQSLRFVFTDSNYSDNRGGVSLDLSLLQEPSNGVPTPGTALLLGLGMAALARGLTSRPSRAHA